MYKGLLVLAILLVIGFLPLHVSARKVTHSSQKSNKQKLNCNKSELKRKICRLQDGSFIINFTKDRITLNDGTWTEVHDLPLKDSGVIWEKVSFTKINQSQFIWLEVWNVPEGPLNLMDLYWFVFEINGSKWTQRLNFKIQKARWEDSKIVKKDRLYQHGLKKDKDKVKWWYDHQEGVF